ncbi:E3 ubiquitin- ligase RNF8-like isoform X2, partial [Olea europaea subsp. europaea]
VYADGRPNLLTHGRKATVRDFYVSAIILTCSLKNKIAAVILPSLQRIHNNFIEIDSGNNDNHGLKSIIKKRLEGDNRFSNLETERDDECGICLEPCTKIVLPKYCHAMCINYYHDWNTRSESCPFCRGTIRRVKSRDLWGSYVQ